MPHPHESLILRLPEGKELSPEQSARLLSRKKAKIERFRQMPIEDVKKWVRGAMFTDLLNQVNNRCSLLPSNNIPRMLRINERFNDDTRFLADLEILELAEMDSEIQQIDSHVIEINQYIETGDTEKLKSHLSHYQETIRRIVEGEI
jgi:FtsZ-binding cell division protein ZapB